ncbi:hypothetical protein CBR_g27761 [Chara braunii]|uniref:Uncharacterized protein n=1 Tax=Chara braunii TaxID=69332 RepID=A0A388L8A6_CHABU|nr:hypothetical protein CBR_g27761 [Chara braunii]|eukprot:GBG78536.1 hypothetical protein CBR_g27761 [Chara braunii]
MSLEAASGMDIDGEVGRDGLSTTERTVVAAAVNVVLFRCQMASREGKFKAVVRARRKLSALPTSGQCLDVGAISDAVLQVCYVMGCGAFPRATPRWWMKRRTGGTWEDLRQCDDATNEYFKDKLRMSPRVFREIAETRSPLLQRRVTFYRVPLQPDHIIAYALYMWVTGETYDSGTCSFGIGRSSGITAVRDVTAALLTAYPDKISWATDILSVVTADVHGGFKRTSDTNKRHCQDVVGGGAVGVVEIISVVNSSVVLIVVIEIGRAPDSQDETVMLAGAVIIVEVNMIGVAPDSPDDTVMQAGGDGRSTAVDADAADVKVVVDVRVAFDVNVAADDDDVKRGADCSGRV